MFYKIVREGKSSSYPYESTSRFISANGKDWVMDFSCPFPEVLVEKAYAGKIKANQVREFAMRVPDITWEDVQRIVEIADEMIKGMPDDGSVSQEDYYKAVLEEFNTSNV